jgi:hypothetical protein
MDTKKKEEIMDAAEDMEATAANTAEGTDTDDQEDQEISLVLKLRKPYVFDGRQYTEVDLTGLEDTTAADLSAVSKILSKMGIVSPVPEMTMDFSLHMAARVAKMPVEFFRGLPSHEGIKLKNIVTGFLYGGDGDN